VTLYVLTWFHRQPVDPAGVRSRWSKGLFATPDRAHALESLEARVELARAHAGEGEPKARLDQLRASTAEVSAYQVEGPLTLDLLAEVVSSPPGGDPLSQASTWWSSARVVKAWWGGTDPETRKGSGTPCNV